MFWPASRYPVVVLSWLAVNISLQSLIQPPLPETAAYRQQFNLWANARSIRERFIPVCFIVNHLHSDGTPTKRRVSKRQVSKRPVSKHLKRQVYKTSGLQNVRFTKRQVFKTSGCKKTSIHILYLWLVEIRRFCCSHVCRQSDGCVLFSI